MITYLIIGMLYTAVLYLIAKEIKFSLWGAVPITLFWPFFMILVLSMVVYYAVTGKRPTPKV